MKSYLIPILIILLLTACAEEKEEIPADILDSNTFTAVMIDVQLTEGMNTQKKYVRDEDMVKPETDPYTPIFEKHKVDAETFKRTYEYYSKNPGKMELIYEQVLDSLTKLDAEVKQKFTLEERVKSDSLRAANQRRSDSLRVLRLSK